MQLMLEKEENISFDDRKTENRKSVFKVKLHKLNGEVEASIKNADGVFSIALF